MSFRIEYDIENDLLEFEADTKEMHAHQKFYNYSNKTLWDDDSLRGLVGFINSYLEDKKCSKD